MKETIDFSKFLSFSLVAKSFDVESSLSFICQKNGWKIISKKKQNVSKNGCSPLTTTESLDHQIVIQLNEKVVKLAYTYFEESSLVKTERATKQSLEVLFSLLSVSEPFALYGIETDGNRLNLLV